MKKTRLLTGLLSLAILSSCTKELNEPNDSAEINPNVDAVTGAIAGRQQEKSFVPNEVLIKFKKGISASARGKALERISGNVREHILTTVMQRLGDEGVFLVHTPLAVLDALAKAKGLEIEFAEPNWVYNHYATSNDTYFTNGTLWGMYGDASTPANQFGSQAAEAWAGGNTGTGTAVYIGVIDEGIQYNHPDLNGQVRNPGESLNADGIDNDNNGYVDDIYGWDFDGGNNTVYDGGTKGSLDDHGTHVAGTIGAKGGNSSGVVGVSWGVKMISGKFLGRRGGTTANAIKAVDYFTNFKNKGLNLVATNNSWGGGGYSQALYDAIKRARDAGVLFIAAAGNSGTDNDVTASYPSNYDLDNVIAVAAIDKTGALASFSQYGKTTVDLGAPGVAIASTTAYNTYSSYSGTSMATPHVSGGAALYAASHQGASAATIKNAILSSVIPTASLNGKTVTGGRLNVSGF